MGAWSASEVGRTRSEGTPRLDDRPPDLAEWLRWPADRVAAWISARPHPLVMGWPFNGTRRWYLSYRLRNPGAGGDYLTTMGRRQAELHRMVFAHGVSVLLAPHFGTSLLLRGQEYTRYALGGLLRLAEDAVYKEMYAAGLRVRFYGDYREKLADPFFSDILDACEELQTATASGDGPLLLVGLFADDPYGSLARLSVEFGRKRGRAPDRRELIESYYGVPIPDLGLYLGFAQHALFDVPLPPPARKTSTPLSTPRPASPRGNFARYSTITS